jgi:hypothetical protein
MQIYLLNNPFSRFLIDLTPLLCFRGKQPNRRPKGRLLFAMPLVNPQHFRLLKTLGRWYSRELHPQSRQHSFSAQPLLGPAGKPKQELLSREKTDAQQALLEEAADSAAQLLLGRSRKSTAETWALRWDDCLLAN